MLERYRKGRPGISAKKLSKSYIDLFTLLSDLASSLINASALESL